MQKQKNIRSKCLAIALIMTLSLTGCGNDVGQSEENTNIVTVQPSHTPEEVENEAPAEPSQEVNSSDIPETPITEADTPADSDLVRVLDYIPTIQIELKYATTDNFTGEVIYDFTEAQLRYGTVKKLAAAQEELEKQGYSLKIWDAYRPVSAQFKLWEICPDATYVANPNTGHSSHSRGNTVDVTLVLADGSEVEMPTMFDDFSDMADRDYSDVPERVKSNVLILENVMSANGFSCYFGEWWHYSDSASYSVIENK